VEKKRKIKINIKIDKNDFPFLDSLAEERGDLWEKVCCNPLSQSFSPLHALFEVDMERTGCLTVTAACVSWKNN
jgi:hypothetical protein